MRVSGRPIVTFDYIITSQAQIAKFSWQPIQSNGQCAAITQFS